MHPFLRRLARCATPLALATALLPAQAANIVTGATDLGTLTTPWALTYGHAFNDLDAGTAGLQLAGVPVTLAATDNFYDDYTFVISGAVGSSITATIDLGNSFNIDNLAVRLYQGTLQTTTTGTLSAADLVQRWSQPLAALATGTGEVQVIAPVSLAPGKYILEVRGNVIGQYGGAYSGVLNLAPVPEPQALALAMAGFAALVVLRRRAKR